MPRVVPQCVSVSTMQLQVYGGFVFWRWGRYYDGLEWGDTFSLSRNWFVDSRSDGFCKIQWSPRFVVKLEDLLVSECMNPHRSTDISRNYEGAI